MICERKSCGPFGGHEQSDTGTSFAGLGMEHPEAVVEVEVKANSWRGVVEAAAEVRLNNLGPFQAPYIPQEVGK